MNDQCDCGWPVDGVFEHGPNCSSIAHDRWADDGGYCPPSESLRRAGKLMLAIEGAYHNDARCLS